MIALQGKPAAHVLNLAVSSVNALGRDTFESSTEQKDLLMPLGLLQYT